MSDLNRRVQLEAENARLRKAAKQADITLMSLESMWGNVFTEKAINNIAHARNLLQDACDE